MKQPAVLEPAKKGGMVRVKESRAFCPTRDRLSVVDPAITGAITLLRRGDCQGAIAFCAKNKIDLDAHASQENTLLTEAAKLGDRQALFTLLQNGANPYATCDCPQHNSFAHYLAYGRSKAHADCVRAVFGSGSPFAVSPNVQNASGKTPVLILDKLIKTYEDEQAGKLLSKVSAFFASDESPRLRNAQEYEWAKQKRAVLTEAAKWFVAPPTAKAQLGASQTRASTQRFEIK